MKKFLKRCIVFTIIIIVTYPVFIFISAEFFPYWLRPNVQYFKNGDGYMYQRLQEADTSRQIDILFLGSSHTYQAYDPGNFAGYRIMNLGSSNQTHLQTLFLMEKYGETFKPRLIIYEINPNMLNNDDTESSIDIISNSELSQKSFDLIHADNVFRISNTIIYKFIKDKIASDVRSAPVNDALGDKYISAGFVRKNKGDNTKFNTEDFIYIPSSVNAYALKALHRNIELIQERRIPLILVYTPVTSLFYTYTGGEEKIRDVLHQYSALPYYNFNELYTWNDTTDFYDEHHLNSRGVQKYNLIITGIIDSLLPAAH